MDDFNPFICLQVGIGGAQSSEEFWRTYSAYTSGYQSVDRLSDIDEFEESFKYLRLGDIVNGLLKPYQEMPLTRN